LGEENAMTLLTLKPAGLESEVEKEAAVEQLLLELGFHAFDAHMAALTLSRGEWVNLAHRKEESLERRLSFASLGVSAQESPLLVVA
jgi:hypothetical protein